MKWSVKWWRENILRYGVIATVFLVPLVYYSSRVYPHFTSKTFFFYGIGEILVAFWLYTVAVDHTYRLTKKQWMYLIPWGLYVLWMTIAGVRAINPHLSLWGTLMRGTGLLTLYHCSAYVLMVVSLVRRYGVSYVHTILSWFVGSAGIVALTVWCGNEGLNFSYVMLQKSSGGGLIGNSSLAAAYLLFALFFGTYLLTVSTLSRTRKWWIGSAIAIIFFSPLFIDLHGLVVGTGLLGSARGATFGIIVAAGVATLGYLALSPQKVYKRTGIGALIAVGGAGVYFWVQLITPHTFIHEKFIGAASGTRFLFWDVARAAMREQPLWGYGPENYIIAFQRYFNPQFLLRQYNFEAWGDRAHNIYFDVGASGGYPALLWYGAFFASILYGLFTLQKQGTLSRLQTALLGGLVVGYLFQNLFVFDSLVSLLALMLLGGVVYGLLGEREPVSNGLILTDPSKKAVLGSILVGLTLVALVFFALRPAQKAAAFGTILNMPVDKRPVHYKELLHGSSVGNDWDVGAFTHSEFQLYAKNPEQIKNNPILLPYVQKDIAAFIAYAEEIAVRNPTDYRLYLSIVHLYATQLYLSDTPLDQAHVQHVLALATHARTLAPRDPQVYWAQAQIYIWMGDFAAAEQSYKDAIALDTTLPTSYHVLLSFAKGSNNKALYMAVLAQAVNLIPGFTPAP